ncbi:MAG TPA: type II toxin-antitoxin system HicA family toxin [Verrucomicrobiae bacterium]|nr:type II toxin-antitoxin system HicA family toxin [Verrucomicrobiae bacterium]
MTPKLPVLSGDQLIKILEKFGYVRVRQKGSHVRLRHSSDLERVPVTVPLHKTLKRGLLHRLLRDAGITQEQLKSYL